MPCRSFALALSRASSFLQGTLAFALTSNALLPSAHAQAAPASAYEQALNAYLEADFATARSFAEEALAGQGTSTHDLAMSYALLAVLSETEGAPGSLVEARIDFAVSIDREVQAPPGVSRAFAQRFEQVRAARRADAPAIQIERRGNAASATMRNAPEGLVQAVELTCDAAGPHAATGELVAELEAPSAIRSCTASARDAAGHVLFTADANYSIDLAAATPTATQEDNTLWIVLGVVGGALVIGGAITIGILASPRDAMLGAPTVTGWPR